MSENIKYVKELGFDVSEMNCNRYGDPDFKLMKKLGATFVIVRSSFGKTFGQADSKFIEYVARAKDAGLLVGAYHYSYALSPRDAILEAESCMDIIERSGYQIDLPIWFDMEDADGYKSRHGFCFSRRYITDICKSWLDNFKYHSGVYASLSWFDSYIEWRRLDCSVWNARFLSNRIVDRIVSTGDLNLLDGEDDIGGYMFQFTDSYPLGDHIVDANIRYVPITVDE